MGYLEWDNFLVRLDGNHELARELAQDFLASVEVRWAAYTRAIESLNPQLIERSAHALRGLMAPYGGEAALTILKRVEESARKGDGKTPPDKEKLRDIVDQMKTEIVDQLRRIDRKEGLP